MKSNGHRHTLLEPRRLLADVAIALDANPNLVSLRVEEAMLVATIDGVVQTFPVTPDTHFVVSDAGGNDTITVGSSVGATISIDTGSGNDSVILEAGIEAAGLNLQTSDGDDRLDIGLVSSGAPVDIASFAIDLGTGTDAIALLGTAGDDVITLDEPTQIGSSLRTNVFGLERISIDGGGGNDLIRLDGYHIHRIAFHIDGGEGNDTIAAAMNHWSTLNTETTLLGGTGDDTFSFSAYYEWTYLVDSGVGNDRIKCIGRATADTLNLFPGRRDFSFGSPDLAKVHTIEIEPIIYESGGSEDVLNVYDNASTVGAVYDVSPSTVIRDGVPLLASSDHERTRIYGGSGDDIFNVRGAFDSGTPRFEGGGGTDTLLLDESTESVSRQYKVGVTVSRDGRSVGYTEIEQATLRAGTASDSIELTPLTTSAFWTIDGNAPSATGGDSLAIRVAGVSIPTITETSPGIGQFTATNGKDVDYRDIESAQLVAPAVTSGSFIQGLDQLHFALETAATPFPANELGQLVEIVNLTTGQPVPTTLFRLSQSSTSISILRTASAGEYPDGDYQAIFHADQLRDLAGNVFGADRVVNFSVLAGDVTLDRRVDFDDLLRLAQNYGRSSNPGTYLYNLGDLNGSGQVNFDDLLILARAFGNSLPAQPVRWIAPRMPTRRALDGLVS